MISVEERLYIETDSSCATCGVKDHRVLTEHHLKKKKRELGYEAYDNKILLCHNCHHRITHKKGLTRKGVRDLKRRLIMKTLTPPGLNAMKEAYRKGIVMAMPFLVNHLIELRYIQWKETVGSHILEEYDTEAMELVVIPTECIYSLTSDGKKLLDTWNLK